MTVFNSDNHSSDNSEQLDKHTLDVLSPETIVLDKDNELSLVENSPIMAKFDTSWL